MRKVTQAMVQAILEGGRASVGNSVCSTESLPNGHESRVFLHGNLIFIRRVENGVSVDTFPYKGMYALTSTTKDRIRGICFGLGIPRPEGY